MISRKRRDNDALGVRNAAVDRRTDAISDYKKRRFRRYIWARLINVWPGSARWLILVLFGIILTFTVVISRSLVILQRDASAPQVSYGKLRRQPALRKGLIKIASLNDNKVTKPQADTRPKQVPTPNRQQSSKVSITSKVEIDDLTTSEDRKSQTTKHASSEDIEKRGSSNEPESKSTESVGDLATFEAKNSQISKYGSSVNLEDQDSSTEPQSESIDETRTNPIESHWKEAKLAGLEVPT
jgi:hypothetical protein